MNKLLVTSISVVTLSVGGWVSLEYSRAQPQGHTQQSSSGARLENQVRIEERDGYRYFIANGIPNHTTGQFPNRRNPNSISAQSYRFRVPLEPKIADKITPLPQGMFGIALNGIPFDPGTAEYWNRDRNSGWREAAHPGIGHLGLDHSNAHVQPSGSYHYHGLPLGWLGDRLNADKPQMLLTGYAFDGFPIYSLYAYSEANNAQSKLVPMRSSYRLKQGTRPGGTTGPGGRYDGTYDQDYEYVEGAGDMDECNGRMGVTPESPKGTYYYILTEEYPYVPRAFKGTPVLPPRPQGGPWTDGRRGPRNGPPPGHPPYPHPHPH